MVGIQLPENPNQYMMVLSIISFFLGISFLIVDGKESIIFWVFGVIGTIVFAVAFSGLKKTQDLKDNKIKEEIKLLQVQQEKTDMERFKIKCGG